MPPDLPRLRTTLGQPELVRLLDALAQRLERGRPLTGRLTLPSATTAERQAADSLLGRNTTRGGSLQVDLDFLAEMFRDAGLCASLRDAVEALRGPVPDLRAHQEQLALSWNAVRVQGGNTLCCWPVLLPWLDDLFESGQLKRIAGSDLSVATRLMGDVELIASELPVNAEPLATFAARLFGDAHALDAGSPRATLAVRAAALLGCVSFEDDAEGRRTAWASVGIVCDELSTPALVFNLPAQGDTPVGRLLRSSRADAEPLHLSLRHLLLWPLSTDPALRGLEVFVCENPTIVALAARRLGTRCAPLICVNGQFATPVKMLLRQLTAAGARLRYHGDFDIGGLVIARRVIAEHQATPWRLGAADYLAAPKGKAFSHEAILSTPWEPALAEAMGRECRAVHEEALAVVLLEDLALPG